MDLRTILTTAQQQRSIPGLLSMLRGGDPQIGGGGGVPRSVASTMAASDAMSGRGGGGQSDDPYAAERDRYGTFDYNVTDKPSIPKISSAAEAAAQGGTTPEALMAGFFPRYVTDRPQDQGYSIPSDRGGFFTAKDLFQNSSRGSVPQIGSFMQESPSTNNWRLLGMGPGWIMRNGQLIDTNSAQAGGPGNWVGSGGISAEHFVAGRANTPLGAGQGYGVPNMLQIGAGHGTSWGWPGAKYWNSTSQY